MMRERCFAPMAKDAAALIGCSKEARAIWPTRFATFTLTLDQPD
jgi:hypothetical protein